MDLLVLYGFVLYILKQRYKVCKGLGLFYLCNKLNLYLWNISLLMLMLLAICKWSYISFLKSVGRFLKILLLLVFIFISRMSFFVSNIVFFIFKKFSLIILVRVFNLLTFTLPLYLNSNLPSCSLRSICSSVCLFPHSLTYFLFTVLPAFLDL